MRSIKDVIEEIRAGQIARGFPGLTREELKKMELDLQAENDEYDREMSGFLDKDNDEKTKV